MQACMYVGPAKCLLCLATKTKIRGYIKVHSLGSLLSVGLGWLSTSLALPDPFMRSLNLFGGALAVKGLVSSHTCIV